MSNSFVQVPPQSTGKKVRTEERTKIEFDGQTLPFFTNVTVQGATSGATGIITAIDTDGYATNKGALFLSDLVGTFVDNESLQIDGSTKALVDFSIYAQETIATQATIIIDPDNPTYKQKIDKFGATINSFTDGAPVFGSFGTMSVGEPQTSADYRFAYNERTDLFYDETSGSGTIAYESASSACLMTCSTTSGDLSRRTSNQYHNYVPGVGSLLECSVAVGDAGKANVIRRWGYYDTNNGVFFELDGTNLSVVLRSNSTGSIVNTVINQTDWSHDNLDGSDVESFIIDVTKGNIYWIDFQWLGAGRIRYGIMDGAGSRIVAHVIENANTSTVFPYMRTATLPFRIEQENTGASGSTSEIRFVCATVKHSSKAFTKGNQRAIDSGLKTITTAGGEVPILAVRPKTTFNSLANHASARGTSLSLANMTDNGGGTILFRVRVGIDAHLTGENFVSLGTDTIAESDVTATAVSNTAAAVTNYAVVADNDLFIKNEENRALHIFELQLQADEVTQPTFIVTAECMNGVSANVMCTLNWEEVLL